MAVLMPQDLVPTTPCLTQDLQACCDQGLQGLILPWPVVLNSYRDRHCSCHNLPWLEVTNIYNGVHRQYLTLSREDQRHHCRNLSHRPCRKMGQPAKLLLCKKDRHRHCHNTAHHLHRLHHRCRHHHLCLGGLHSIMWQGAVMRGSRLSHQTAMTL